MAKYVVRSPVTLQTPAGNKTFKKGEALRLSSSNAISLVARGYLVEQNVGLDLMARYDARVISLMKNLGYSKADAQAEARQMVASLLKRHESFKHVQLPSEAFLGEVAEFNRNTKGKTPLSQVKAKKGVGEWAGYRCNIGTGCSHGCLYCFAEDMAVVRYHQVKSPEEWRTEVLRKVSTARCRKRKKPIMFPTSHDITPVYLKPYRCHLYNLLQAGNKVLVVSKPHRECIQAICEEFLSFRDTMTFRFTIGSLSDESMRHWEPGAPPVQERLECLRHAFECGFSTSISAEPMLGGKEEAERLYYLVEPYATEEIWFGKMQGIGGLKTNEDPNVALKARELTSLQTDDEIMQLVDHLKDLPKVKWKDSITEIINKRTF